MTKKTRTILFFIFICLFLLIAPSVIFYSQGYRFDFENKKLTQTGGLFFKVEPKQVEVYIDNKLAKKTDFFFGSVLIENLLPRKYKIKLEKEGYSPWEKSLDIREREVVEAKNIVLFPENLNFNLLTKETENLWFSPDGKKIILYEKSEKLWALKLYDLEKNIKSHLISETDVYPKGADLMNLEFSEDSKEIYLDVGIKEQEKYFTLRLDKSPPQLTERKITQTPKNIVASRKINNDFYYLDNFGFVFKNEAKLNEQPFLVQQETEYGLEIFQNFVFLREGKTLYLLNPNLKSFEKFFEPIENLKISPNLKKIVYFSDYEIWILFLEDVLERPQKKSGEKLFLTRFSDKIEDVFWLNSNYLIFGVGDKIKIAEIDDRDKINIVDLAAFKTPQIIFNQTDKKLYLLSENNLYVSEVLIK